MSKLQIDNVANPFNNSLAAIDNSVKIGALLLSSGKISGQDIERIFAVQKQQGLRFGEAAKALGLVSDEDIQIAVARQFDFPLPEPGTNQFSQELYSLFRPFDRDTESLRNLRGQLLLRWFNNVRKSLAVVSSGRGEGRSNLVANLAVIFAQLGKRCLVVDADLRQPRQHAIFKLSGSFGLADILAGRADKSAVVEIAPFQTLSVLPAGTIPPNPVELITRHFENTLKQLALQYDIILIDTPAGNAVIDAQIIAAISGGALLLARQNHTVLSALSDLKTNLETLGCECLGSVMTTFED